MKPRALVLGLALAGLVAAGAFGVQATLRQPSPADALAVRIVQKLELIRSVTSMQTLSWLPKVEVRCTARPGDDTVWMSDGRSLTVDPGNIHRIHGRWIRPLLIDAVGRLAACPGIISAELGTRLFAGKKVLVGTMRFHGRPAYRLRVDNEPPRVVLIVSRRTLLPLGVSFWTLRLHGTSHIEKVRLQPAPADG
jgi:hypothetical protein